jgi:hypothetical protein
MHISNATSYCWLQPAMPTYQRQICGIEIRNSKNDAHYSEQVSGSGTVTSDTLQRASTKLHRTFDISIGFAITIDLQAS